MLIIYTLLFLIVANLLLHSITNNSICYYLPTTNDHLILSNNFKLQPVISNRKQLLANYYSSAPDYYLNATY